MTVNRLRKEQRLHHVGLGLIVLGGVLAAIGLSGGGEVLAVGAGLVGLGVMIWFFKWFFIDPYGKKGGGS